MESNDVSQVESVLVDLDEVAQLGNFIQINQNTFNLSFFIHSSSCDTRH